MITFAQGLAEKGPIKVLFHMNPATAALCCPRQTEDNPRP